MAHRVLVVTRRPAAGARHRLRKSAARRTHALEETEQVLPQKLKSYTPNTITDRGMILEQIAEVRASGLAWDHDEHTMGVSGVAGTIHDVWGETAVITIPVPSLRFNGREPELGHALRADMRAVQWSRRRSGFGLERWARCAHAQGVQGASRRGHGRVETPTLDAHLISTPTRPSDSQASIGQSPLSSPARSTWVTRTILPPSPSARTGPPDAQSARCFISPTCDTPRSQGIAGRPRQGVRRMPLPSFSIIIFSSPRRGDARACLVSDLRAVPLAGLDHGA